MAHDFLQRFRDLQAYVGWTEEDAARAKIVARLIEPHMDTLIDDFYAEVQRHADSARVLTGGKEQINRLSASLAGWMRESMQARSDSEYVQRRWRIGLRHAEIGLNAAYTGAAMSRLRNGIIGLISAEFGNSPQELPLLIQTLNKLLDLDLAIIQDAYESEHLRHEKLAEQARSEVKFRKLVEAAAAMVIILREDQTIAYFSPYSEALTGYSAAEVTGWVFVRALVRLCWLRRSITIRTRAF